MQKHIAELHHCDWNMEYPAPAPHKTTVRTCALNVHHWDARGMPGQDSGAWDSRVAT